MKKTLKNSANSGNNLLGRLAAEKKKTVSAVCLIAVMVFMWARVIGNKTPHNAAAVMRQDNLAPDSEGSNLELNISYVELPKVAGRNDVLTRDFFAADNWQNFIRKREGPNSAGIEEVSVVSGDGNEEIVKRIAEKLKLEAIGMDENPQAFINGKLLSPGDKLFVKDGAETYECEVVRIEENVVILKCGKAEITLKLTKIIEVGD
jgi:hypothetical protein